MSEHFSFPPFRMKAKQAAFYCGMSETQFRAAVSEGEMPNGQKRRGGTYWLRRDLEAAMLPEQKGKGKFGARI